MTISVPEAITPMPIDDPTPPVLTNSATATVEAGASVLELADQTLDLLDLHKYPELGPDINSRLSVARSQALDHYLSDRITPQQYAGVRDKLRDAQVVAVLELLDPQKYPELGPDINSRLSVARSQALDHYLSDRITPQQYSQILGQLQLRGTAPAQ